MLLIFTLILFKQFVSSLLGNFGLYHLNMMIFTFMRNIVFAIDTFALTVSQISTKDANISCKNTNAYHYDQG